MYTTKYTLYDVIEFIGLAKLHDETYGLNKYFKFAFRKRVRILARIISEELEISLREAKKLPPETKLGEKAEDEFLNLQKLFYKYT